MNEIDNQIKNEKIILIAIMSLSFMFYTSMFYVSPLIPDIITDYNVSYVTISSLMYLLFIPQIIFSIYASSLISRFNEKVVVLLGIIFISLGALIFAIDYHFVFLQIGRFIIGVGVALSFVAAMTFVSKYFGEKKRATASGFIALTYSLSILFSFNIFGWVAASINYKYSAWLMFMLSLAIGVPFSIAIRCFPTVSEKSIKMVNFMKGLKNKQMLMLALLWLTLNMGIGAYLTWIKVFLMSYKGISPILADFLSSMMMLLGFFRPLVGMLSDRLKKRKIFITTSTFGYSMTVLLLPFLDGTLIYIDFLVMSIASVFVAPIVLALPGDIMKEDAEVGYGILNTGANIGYLIGPIITAYLFDTTGLLIGFISIGLFFMFSFILSIFLKVG
ncbi:MAG: MFS transporter [Candidatus Odinarchaeota archaeon]|nr:MFS transporter [Candidatus Odinarchaeota archaeon]